MNDDAVKSFKPGDENQITMTDSALAHLQKKIAARGAGIGMRLGVTTTGCNGYQYEVDYIDHADDDDLIFPVAEGLSVYVSPEHFQIVSGTRIDYVRKGLNEVFEFYNPRQTGACGCGESFSID